MAPRSCRRAALLPALALLLPVAPLLGAQTPTRVAVHVVTHDAKLIGSAVGGARVTVRDAATGRVLAEGLHEGGTGSTPLIITTPRERGRDIFGGEDAAGWTATLPLTAPTTVDVTAEGPLGYPDQLARATKRLVLVPGEHVEGDGVVLELHGYVLDVLAPAARDSSGAAAGSSGAADVDAPRAGVAVPVRARVRMLCSCPTGPDALWSVERVRARLRRADGTVAAEAPLAFAGEASTYAGTLPAVAGGDYTLEIVAANADRASFGVVRRAVTVR